MEFTLLIIYAVSLHFATWQLTA